MSSFDRWDEAEHDIVDALMLDVAGLQVDNPVVDAMGQHPPAA